MSICEHLPLIKSHNRAKNGDFVTGMSLVKGNVVNLRFTHKELTLVIGIIVALIVALTLWINLSDTNTLLGIKKSDLISTHLTGEFRKSVLKLRFF